MLPPRLNTLHMKSAALCLVMLLSWFLGIQVESQAQNPSLQLEETTPWSMTGLPCQKITDCGNRINTLSDGGIFILNTTLNQLYYLYPDGSPPSSYNLSEFSDPIVDFKPLDEQEIVLMTLARSSGNYELTKLVLPGLEISPLTTQLDSKIISCDSTPSGSNEMFHALTGTTLLICSYVSPNVYNINLVDITDGTIISTPLTVTGSLEGQLQPWLFLIAGNQDGFFVLFSDLDRTPPTLALLQQFVPSVIDLPTNQVPVLHYSLSQDAYDLRFIPKSAFSRIPNGRGALVFEIIGEGAENTLYLRTAWFDEDGNHTDIVKLEGNGDVAWRLTEAQIPSNATVIKFITSDKILVASDTNLILATITLANEIPVANAGADQTVIAADGVSAQVTLDASASTDSDGSIVAYLWSENGTEIATGVQPTVTLAVGTHTLTLTVTDDDGATAIDFVAMTVEDT